MTIGVLNAEQVLRDIIHKNPSVLKCDRDITESPEASSIDAPLGDCYYEMPGSCRPGAQHAVTDIIRTLRGKRMPLTTEGTILERGQTCLIPLSWGIALPKNICVRATAKSSIGRLDALVRLVADREPEFDRVGFGHTCNLYVEVAPLTFHLKVKSGKALSQLRFMKGDEDLCTVPVRELTDYEDEPVLVGSSNAIRPSEGDGRGVLLSLDTTPDERVGFIGFVARKDVSTAIDPGLRKVKHEEDDPRYDPHEFWEPVKAEEADAGLVRIERDRFYIFRSVERFRIPRHLAVECQAYSEGMGDIRIHYAGFAHPWFGHERAAGTPLIFEVRGHSVDTFLRHGDALAKVFFRRMSEPAPPPKPDNSSYDSQELNLSACFRPWV